MRSGLRGPADFAAETDRQGRYFLDLAPGRYWLVSRFRRQGGEAGPPRPGDAWKVFTGNPVTVVSGAVAEADFVLQATGGPMPVMSRTPVGERALLTGQLVDQEGHPLAGAFVLVYPGPDFYRMPERTSAPVDSSGHFSLPVPPGRWCMAARTRTRGQPLPGEPYGRLGDGPEGCREVAAGESVDIGKIVLSPYRGGD